MSQFTVIYMQEKMSGRTLNKKELINGNKKEKSYLLGCKVFEIYFLCYLLEHAGGGDSSVVRVPDS